MRLLKGRVWPTDTRLNKSGPRYVCTVNNFNLHGVKENKSHHFQMYFQIQSLNPCVLHPAVDVAQSLQDLNSTNENVLRGKHQHEELTTNSNVYSSHVQHADILSETRADRCVVRYLQEGKLP